MCAFPEEGILDIFSSYFHYVLSSRRFVVSRAKQLRSCNSQQTKRTCFLCRVCTITRHHVIVRDEWSSCSVSCHGNVSWRPELLDVVEHCTHLGDWVSYSFHNKDDITFHQPTLPSAPPLSLLAGTQPPATSAPVGPPHFRPQTRPTNKTPRPGNIYSE